MRMEWNELLQIIKKGCLKEYTNSEWPDKPAHLGYPVDITESSDFIHYWQIDKLSEEKTLSNLFCLPSEKGGLL